MTGTVALHGGGEFLPGDEPFLRAILGLAPARDGVVRIAVVPTAAARGRPDLAAKHGLTALREVASKLGVRAEAEAVRVVDHESAADPDLAGRLAAARLIHLPGGDPDLIPTLYPGSVAWAAIGEALAAGAVLAGASAGAMALASLTWTGRAVVPGLGLVPGVLVVPHADAASWPHVLARHGGQRPPDTAILGIGERTGVIIPPGAADGTQPWRVVGEGEVRWVAAGASDPAGATIVVRDGESFSPVHRAA
jgi:cyanophycinase-like exopeptidase